jgi:hypothetical protein
VNVGLKIRNGPADVGGAVGPIPSPELMRGSDDIGHAFVGEHPRQRQGFGGIRWAVVDPRQDVTMHVNNLRALELGQSSLLCWG